jgi:hypothetical protein
MHIGKKKIAEIKMVKSKGENQFKGVKITIIGVVLTFSDP